MLIGLVERRTSPLIWCAAIICTIVAVAVTITGVAVFVGYMIIQPKLPFISVAFAQLDKLNYDMTGVMDVQITMDIKAENDNVKAHASFSDISFLLSFSGIKIAELAADPFDIPKNSSTILHFVIPSSSIPLDEEGMDEIDMSLKQDRLSFTMNGNVRTRWSLGFVGTVKFWSHLDCELKFFPSNGTRIDSDCSSKSH